MARKNKTSKLIASKDGIVSEESNLPYPFVYYPGFYGAYFAFSKGEKSEIYFCSCSKKSIANYIKFRIEYGAILNSNSQKNFILSSAQFPQKVVENLIKKNEYFNPEIFSQLNFKDGICHECNKQTPIHSYCDPMYGGVFEQNYGWYINKQSFEYGVKPVSFKMLEEVCPDEVFNLLDIEKSNFLSKYNQFDETILIMLNAQDSIYQKITRQIRNNIENEVRVKFGFKKVGEAWANETLLYQLVCEIFPECKIYRHYRPSFLEYLELDVFIPHLNIGIEYQGIQHFEPIKHWGGKSSLEKVIERDKRKKKLCDKNDVALIYFYYYEELDKKLVKNKIENCN